LLKTFCQTGQSIGKIKVPQIKTNLIILIYKFYLTKIILIFIYLQNHLELEALSYSFLFVWN